MFSFFLSFFLVFSFLFFFSTLRDLVLLVQLEEAHGEHGVDGGIVHLLGGLAKQRPHLVLQREDGVFHTRGRKKRKRKEKEVA